MQQAGGIMDAMSNTQGNSADASLGGMAQAVDTKVEAYRNNPQALEKRLAGNQQLLDLLALQKVKSEKEAAANQLKLGEQQNPNTIIEQREQEVLDMTKNDMVAQTAGILGQRQKQQQKNMQRTATGGNAPMMAARGGLLPLPRPNMQNMAQGGIIGYDAGGVIDAETEKKLEEKLGSNWEEKLNAMSPEAINNMAAGMGIRASLLDKFGSTFMGNVLGGIGAIPGAIGRGIDNIQANPIVQGITGNYGGEKAEPEVKEPDVLLTAKDLTDAQGGKTQSQVAAEKAAAEKAAADKAAADKAAASPVVVTKDPSLEEKAKIASTEGVKGLEESIAKSAKETPLADAMKNNGLAEALRIREDTTGIPAAQKAAIAASDENLGRDTKEKENERLIADEKAYTARQLDPEKLRKQGLQSALIGMGQRGLLGAAMGVQQSDAQTEKFEISQRAKTVKMIQDKQKTDIDVAKIGETNARNVYSTLHAKSDAAMNAMVGATQAELELAGQRADQLIARYGQDLDAKFKVLDAEYKDKILAATQEENQGKRLSDLLAIVTETDIKVNEFLSADPNYSEGQKIAAEVNGDPEKRQELSPEEAALYDAYEATRAGLDSRNATLQKLQKEIEKIAGISGTTGTYPVDE